MQSRPIALYYDIVVYFDEHNILRSYIVVYYFMLLFSKVQTCECPPKHLRTKIDLYYTVLGIFSPQHFKIHHRFLRNRRLKITDRINH